MPHNTLPIPAESARGAPLDVRIAPCYDSRVRAHLAPDAGCSAPRFKRAVLSRSGAAAMFRHGDRSGQAARFAARGLLPLPGLLPALVIPLCPWCGPGARRFRVLLTSQRVRRYTLAPAAPASAQKGAIS